MKVTNGLFAEMLDTILLPPLYGSFPLASPDLVCGVFKKTHGIVYCVRDQGCCQNKWVNKQ